MTFPILLSKRYMIFTTTTDTRLSPYKSFNFTPRQLAKGTADRTNEYLDSRCSAWFCVFEGNFSMEIFHKDMNESELVLDQQSVVSQHGDLLLKLISIVKAFQSIYFLLNFTMQQFAKCLLSVCKYRKKISFL